jgi:glyoxylase-like metal-dependent hydrolase (beta-lactamase superfamily II)
MSKQTSSFEHFTLDEVAEGVYAAIAVAGKAAFSNAGIVDLGDRVIIFDTFETPIAARELRHAAESLTGNPVAYVVISHGHNDHWLGNQVFADTTIIATHATRVDMRAFATELEETKANPTEIEAFILGEQERLAQETDGRRRLDIEHSIARWQYMLQALPTLEIFYPCLTFKDRLVFHGPRRVVELVTRGKGHSSSDCSLILKEKVAFVGDLAFFGQQPFMAYCDRRAWVTQLQEMERSDIKTFVPGHGPVGTKADVTLEKDYILMLEDWVRRAVEKGEPVESILKRPLPKPFDAWSFDGLPADYNVRALYEWLSREREGVDSVAQGR